jgi:hypothetical protein
MSVPGITESLAQALRAELGARPGAEAVIWTDGGDEVVVHAGAAQVRRDGDALLAEVPLESDETGRHVLTVPLLGAGTKTVVTSRRPWGDERLATRWGAQLQHAVAAALGEELVR